MNAVDAVSCPACGGNGRDAPCAFPDSHERQPGCLLASADRARLDFLERHGLSIALDTSVPSHCEIGTSREAIDAVMATMEPDRTPSDPLTRADRERQALARAHMPHGEYICTRCGLREELGIKPDCTF